jgi:replicative DNA helicase
MAFTPPDNLPLDRELLAFIVRFPAEAPAVFDAVSPQEFTGPAARQLFGYFASYLTAGRQMSPRAIYEYTREHRPELRDMVKMVCITAADDALWRDTYPRAERVRLFKEWSYRIRLKQALFEASQMLEGTASPAKVEAELERRIANARQLVDEARQYDDPEAQAAQVIEYLMGEEEAGLRFGFRSFDENLVPLLPGNLMLVCGATGAGKSTVARNLFRNWTRAGKKPVYLTLEMTAADQLLNLACMDTGTDVKDCVTRRLPVGKKALLEDAVIWWKNSGAILNDRSTVTPEALMQTLRRYIADGHDLFIIDHLHRLDYGGSEDDLRVRMGTTAQQLKSFLVEHNAIGVALAQLKKMPPTEEPNDSSIRESAKIGEEADKIVFVYKPQVAGARDATGRFVPLSRENGGRILAHEADKSTELGFDSERIYCVPGKQRIRPTSSLLVTPFNPASGLMYDSISR